MENKSTEEIANEMNNAKSIEELNNILTKYGIGRKTFGDRLLELCANYQVKPSALQLRVAISKSQFYAAINGTREISKENILKIALELGISIEETNELLKLAKHKELYPKNEDDAIILFGINMKMSIDEIDNLLKEYKSKIRLLDK